MKPYEIIGEISLHPVCFEFTFGKQTYYIDKEDGIWIISTEVREPAILFVEYVGQVTGSKVYKRVVSECITWSDVVAFVESLGGTDEV